MFREGEYGAGESDADDYEQSGSKAEIEEEVDNAELVASSRKRFNRLADRMDDELLSATEAILKAVESNYNPDDPDDEWMHVLSNLNREVFDPFERGNTDIAASNLMDIETDVERML